MWILTLVDVKESFLHLPPLPLLLHHLPTMMADATLCKTWETFVQRKAVEINTCGRNHQHFCHEKLPRLSQMLSPPPPLWTPPSCPLKTPTIARVPTFDYLVVQYRKWNWKSKDYWFPCILSGSNSLGFQCQGRWQKIYNYKRFLAEQLMAIEYTGTRRFLIALRSISKGWMQSRQVSEGWMNHSG